METKVNPVNFVLRNKNALTVTAIMLYVRHCNINLRWATGYSIAPGKWDFKRQCPKPGEPYLHEQLKKFESIARNALYNAGFLSQSQFTELMDKLTGRVESEKGPTLLAFARQYCEQNNRKEYKTAVGVIYQYLTKDASASWDKIDWKKAAAKDIPFDVIDWDFRDALQAFCLEKGFAVSYAQLILRRLGQFLNMAEKKKLHKNSISRIKGFTAVKGAGIEKAKDLPIALTLDELTRLHALPLEGKDEAIRDCFLIGCLSGQRWSDYGFIEPSQIGEGMLTIYQQEKTEAFAEVELDILSEHLPFTLGELLAKHGNASPIITNSPAGVNKTADVRINERIKEIARAAGITELTHWSDDKGGKIKKYISPKCELLGTHTARRTFATIWYNLGMNCEEICTVTGHASITQLMTYIGADLIDKRARRRAEIARIKSEKAAQARAQMKIA